MKIHFTEHKTERRSKNEEGTHSELPLFHLLNDWVLLGISKNSLNTGTIFDCVDLCHQVAVLQKRSMMIYSHLDLTKKKKKKGKREIKQGYWGCHRQGPSGNPRKLLNQTSQLAHTCMVRLFFGSWRNGWGAVLPDLFTILNDHTGPVRILITHQHVHFWHHGNFEILFFNVKLSGRVFPGS